MAYRVSADIAAPAGISPLDELQRVGVASLLDEHFESVESVRLAPLDDADLGERFDDHQYDDTEVHLLTHRIGVHPEGALLLLVVDASSLAMAEGAAEAIVRSALDAHDVFAGFTLDSCEVTLNEDAVREALEAVDAPPSDIAERRAMHARQAGPGAADPAELERDHAEMVATLRRAATSLLAFPLDSFLLGPDDLAPPDPERERDLARIAAGALVVASELLVDKLFRDIDTFVDANVDTVGDVEDAAFFVLDDLPPAFMGYYSGLFVKKFLVAAVSVTGRLVASGWTGPACVAEELALHLLVGEAEAFLELFDLDESSARRYAAFRAAALGRGACRRLYELDLDETHEETTSPDDAPVDAPVEAWFLPFDSVLGVHPYAVAGYGIAEEKPDDQP